MSETMVLTGRLNGTGAPEGKSRTGKPKGKGERKPRGGSRKGMRAAKRLAAVCGSVATGVLALSVVHCTQAISSLTGSHWLLRATRQSASTREWSRPKSRKSRRTAPALSGP